MDYRIDTLYCPLPFIIKVDDDVLANEVLLEACRIFGIDETQYFGLKCNCSPSHDWTHHWVNPRVPLAEQICPEQSERPRKLRLTVKFFVEPHILQLPGTRWCFYLDAREAFIQMQSQIGAESNTLSELVSSAIQWADPENESFELRHKVALALAAHRSSVNDVPDAMHHLETLVGVADDYTATSRSSKDDANSSHKVERGKYHMVKAGRGLIMKNIPEQTRQEAVLQLLSQLIFYGSTTLVQVVDCASVKQLGHLSHSYVTYATVTMRGLVLIHLQSFSPRRTQFKVLPLSSVAVVSQVENTVSLGVVEDDGTIVEIELDFITTKMADCLTESLVETVVFHEYSEVPVSVLKETRPKHFTIRGNIYSGRPRFGITCTKQESHERNTRRFISTKKPRVFHSKTLTSTRKANGPRCSICLEEVRTCVVFSPCKHRGVCVDCSAKVQKCPTCLKGVLKNQANGCCTVS